MDKPDLTLYLGGTRSGKSERAEARAARLAEGPVIYAATAEARDAAMRERIRRHRARRPADWRTLERPLRLAEGLAEALAALPCGPKATVLVDCVTLWASNILFSLPDPENAPAFERAVRAEMEAFIALARASGCRFIAVSGEIGLGGVAPSPLGRVYADGLGLANRLLAEAARQAFLVVAGKIIRLEDEEEKM